jgi:hypothetical protein
MIGKDGEFGASQALDDKVSLNHVVIQVPGTASVIDSDRIKEMANELPPFAACWSSTSSSFCHRCSRRQLATPSTLFKPGPASGSCECTNSPGPISR